MFYILFCGKYSKENLSLCTKLSEHWVTFNHNPDNFILALKDMNRCNISSYNLVLLDPYIEKLGERVSYIDKVLKLNHGKRRTAIIKDNHLERSIALFREKYSFYELSKESNLVTAITKILTLN